MTISLSVAVLLIAALAVVWTLWRAHQRADIDFNLLDLLMEGGRVSKIAVAFMLVLGVSTWVIVSLTVNNRLTEGYFSAYGAMWVAPLVARVVFSKTEPPTAGGQNG